MSKWKTTCTFLLDNQQLRIVTNVQVIIQWYRIRMTSLKEGTQFPVTHRGQSHPAKALNGSHPLNVFAEQLILNA